MESNLQTNKHLLSILILLASTYCGLMLALPLAVSTSPSKALSIMVSGSLLGCVIGWKRRKDRWFLYFCLILSALLAMGMMKYL